MRKKTDLQALQSLLPSEDRETLMLQGIEQLHQWLLDTLRVGILKVDLSDSLQRLSVMMVDGKLGSLANRLKLINQLNPSQTDWAELVITELSLLYALTYRIRKLTPDSDIKQKLALYGHAGLNFRKKDILQLGGIDDVWLVLSKYEETHDNLRSRRCWLIGRKSHRFALVLDYAFGRSRFENNLKVGRHYQGKMHYYPALFPFRASQGTCKELNVRVERLPGYESMERFALQYSKAIVRDPWIRRFPVFLKNVRLTAEGKCAVVDNDNKSLSVSNPPQNLWQLISLAGGQKLNLFGDYDGKTLLLQSVLVENAIRPIR